MPRDVQGNYTLPSGYLAETGQTIQPSQHNPPLEDLSAAMTGSLPRDGSAPMTGPLKVTTGSKTTPAISPNNNSAIGLYFTSTGVAFAGSVSGVRYIGELIPYTLLNTTPSYTVLPYGQTLLRASYPDLWTLAQGEIASGNLFYNNGNGSTTFGIGDLRGRVIAGRDGMGGTLAGRLTSAASGVNGAAIGASGGAQTISLTSDQNGAHSHSGTTGGMNRNASHSHGVSGGIYGGSTSKLWSQNDTGGPATATAIVINSTNTDHEHAFSTSSSGSGTAHNNVQPTMVCNYLLYVGA